ncbi:MAG: signal peptidase I [Tannerellaceae bacterium]|nr:signal peptidase I [Tannerellaceae bacterium]
MPVDKKRDKLLRAGTNILFYLCMAVIGWLFLQVFFFASFKTPTGSMAPELLPGDYVLVNKLIFGARLFNPLPALRLEQVDIYRAPGIRNIRRGDVVVFNAPYPHTQERMEMHILKYFVKRCVGLPGDSLLIENGYYRVKGVDEPLGNVAEQGKRSVHPKDSLWWSFDEPVLNCFPDDSIISWNAENFGPLYIPRKGDTVLMNRDSYVLYKTLIEWETKGLLTFQDSTVYLNNRPTRAYTFRSDYYFMAGDNVNDSWDSRYWGLAPAEYIVGNVWLIWKSVDPYTGKERRERWMKQVAPYRFK